jgi:hypothetical protein
MGYMKKMYMEMLLEPSAPYELPSKYSILENAVDSAILDLEKANGKGIFAQHRKVLVWTALRTLTQAKEKCHEET